MGAGLSRDRPCAGRAAGGAGGDRLLHWFSYDETNNPRVAKLSYLEQHHGEYDSYILGCSSTSSFPVDAFNEAYDASFYNLIM